MPQRKRFSSLEDVPIGREVTIRRLGPVAQSVSTRMRELGICENATIRPLLRANGNMICIVKNMRIGIDGSLARAITVDLQGENIAA